MLSIAVVLAIGAMGFVAYQRLSSDSSGEPLQLPGDLHVTLPGLHAAGEAMHTIYLNREGVTLAAGEDDSARNVSSIVAGTGKATARIPAFAGSPQAWNAIAACIRTKFAPFDVSIVEQRPVSGHYIMGVIGGDPEDIGAVADDHHEVRAHDVLGLAPFNGHLVSDAVVLIFSHRMGEKTTATCETAGMEIAHAYGLDHERNCRDIMSYLPPCAARGFVDAPAPCGELADRACEGGSAKQNSFATLLAALGPAVRGAALSH